MKHDFTLTVVTKDVLRDMTVTANKHFSKFHKFQVAEPLYQEVELEALTDAVAQIDKRRIPILTTHFSDQALMIGGSEAADQSRPGRGRRVRVAVTRPGGRQSRVGVGVPLAVRVTEGLRLGRGVIVTGTIAGRGPAQQPDSGAKARLAAAVGVRRRRRVQT